MPSASVSIGTGASGGASAGTGTGAGATPTIKQQQDQLSIARDLTAEFQKQLKLLQQMQQAQGSQRDLAGELRDAVEDTSFDDLIDQAGGFSDATKKISKSLLDMRKASDKSIGKVYDQSQKLDKQLKTMTAVGGSMALALLAFKALVNAVSGLAAVTESAVGFIGGIVSGLFNIGRAIIAIPFRVFEGFVSLSNEVAHILVEIQTAVEGVRKQFGDLKGPVSSTVIQLSRSMQGFAITGLSAWNVVGNLAQRLDFVKELATTLGAVFSKLRGEFELDGGAIIAFEKGLGLAHEELKGIGEVAIVSGKQSRVVLTAMTTQAIALGRAFGVDAKVIGRDVGKALTDVAHFGGATVKQIATASVYARKLGVELDRIVGTLSAFETFDTAAENAAKLSQSFGILVDSFQLIEAQSPDEQIDLLRKALFAAGRSAEGMTRQELKLLAQTTGLDEATARLVFSAKNQGTTLDLIAKKSSVAEKHQLTQAEALVKLSASIERLVRQSPEFTGFFDAMLKGFSRGVVTSGPFTRAVFSLRAALVAVYREGAKLGRSFVDLFPGVRDVLTGIADAFKPGRFQKFAAQFRQALEQFFRQLTVGRGSFTDLTASLRKSFFDFISAETPAGRKIIEGAKSFLLAISKVIGQGVTWSLDALTNSINFIVDLISNPGEVIKKFSSGAKDGATFAQQVFSPIIQAFTDKRRIAELSTAIDDLFDVLELKIGRRIEHVAYSIKDNLDRTAALSLYKSKANIVAKLLDPLLYGREEKDIGGRKVKGFERSVEEDLIKSREERDKELNEKYDSLEKQLAEKRKQRTVSAITDAAQQQQAAVAATQAATSDAQQQLADVAKKRQAEIAAISERIAGGLKADVDPTQRVHRLSTAVDELATLKDRVKRIDVSTFRDLATKLVELETALKPVSDALPQRLSQVVYSLNKIGEIKLTALQNVTKAIKQGVIDATGASVADMVRTVNELDSALSNVAASKLNIAAKLQQLATAVPALGVAGQYKVTNRDVVVTVNLQVTMQAGEVERVIVQRKDSTIRDRLNAAQYKGPIAPAEIPASPTAPAPLPLSQRR
jgi:hypothetical protein